MTMWSRYSLPGRLAEAMLAAGVRVKAFTASFEAIVTLEYAPSYRASGDASECKSSGLFS